MSIDFLRKTIENWSEFKFMFPREQRNLRKLWENWERYLKSIDIWQNSNSSEFQTIFLDCPLKFFSFKKPLNRLFSENWIQWIPIISSSLPFEISHKNPLQRVLLFRANSSFKILSMRRKHGWGRGFSTSNKCESSQYSM